jgi:crotonobetainyl-CoA:carnitine CoA-transferase CaiB-like acyl-CoA transferase
MLQQRHARASSGDVMAGALEGIRVVEFANYVSGPYAGMLLGDLGAEVIKVESPDGGDPFRGWGRVEYSPTFGSVNRNKKSVVLDLKSAQGVAAARALVRTADVLIENFRIGTMERLGLGYDAAARDNPRLVWCSITGFGTSGPYASRPGYDTVGQALSGLLSLLTDLDRPRPMGISLSDHLAGIVACNGVLGALVARSHRQRAARRHLAPGGHGFVLRRECRAFFREPQSSEPRHPRAPGAGLCVRRRRRQAVRDPFVLASQVLAGARPRRRPAGLARRSSLRQQGGARRHYDALNDELAAVFKHDTRAAWLAKLQAEDVPAAALNTLDEVFEDPQVEHLGMRQDVPHPRVGTIGLVRNGLRMSATPPAIRSAAPELGEHTDEILAQLDSAAS